MALTKASLKGHTKAAAAEAVAAEATVVEAVAETATTATVIKMATAVEAVAEAEDEATTAEMEAEGTNKEEEVKAQAVDVGAQTIMLLACSTRSQSSSNKADPQAGTAGTSALAMCSQTVSTPTFAREY